GLVRGLCRQCDGFHHYGLELDGGQFPKSSLSALAVVDPLDPAHDREAQLESAGPGMPVEDVLLQQAEERFHRGVITACTDSPHGSVQLVLLQRLTEFPGPELATPVAVNDDAFRVAAV